MPDTRADSISIATLAEAVEKAVGTLNAHKTLQGAGHGPKIVFDGRIIGFVLDVDRTKSLSDIEALAKQASNHIGQAVPVLRSAGHVPGMLITDKHVTAGFVPADPLRSIVP